MESFNLKSENKKELPHSRAKFNEFQLYNPTLNLPCDDPHQSICNLNIALNEEKIRRLTLLLNKASAYQEKQRTLNHEKEITLNELLKLMRNSKIANWLKKILAELTGIHGELHGIIKDPTLYDEKTIPDITNLFFHLHSNKKINYTLSDAGTGGCEIWGKRTTQENRVSIGSIKIPIFDINWNKTFLSTLSELKNITITLGSGRFISLRQCDYIIKFTLTSWVIGVHILSPLKKMVKKKCQH